MESCSKLPFKAVSHPSLVDVAEECRRLLVALKGKLGLTQNDLSSTLHQTRFKTNTEGQMSQATSIPFSLMIPLTFDRYLYFGVIAHCKVFMCIYRWIHKQTSDKKDVSFNTVFLQQQVMNLHY